MTKYHTIDELINPFKKGSMAIALKQIYNDLNNRFYSHIQQTIKSTSFKIKDTYYIHIKVPSEGNPSSDIKIFYDVILEFTPMNKDHLTSSSIRDYAVKVFCNIPSFMFTFTNSYSKNNLLLDIPKKYYSSEALKSKAVIRNSLDLFGIDKTIWFSVKYMEKNLLYNKNILDVTLIKTNLKDELKNVLPQEDKLKEVQNREYKEKIKRRKAKINNDSTKDSSEKESSKSNLKSLLNNSSTLKNNTMKKDNKSSLTSNNKANLKSSLSKK